jgi:hypothetical protein
MTVSARCGSRVARCGYRVTVFDLNRFKFLDVHTDKPAESRTQFHIMAETTPEPRDFSVRVRTQSPSTTLPAVIKWVQIVSNTNAMGEIVLPTTQTCHKLGF